MCLNSEKLLRGNGGSASVLLCYPDPEGSFMELVIRNLTCICSVLFRSVLLMLMDVSRKLNHDL